MKSKMFSKFRDTHTLARASLVAQMVKNLLAMQDTHIQSLGWEDPLEKGMVASYTVCGVERVRHD